MFERLPYIISLSIGLICWSIYQSLIVAPDEVMMGAIQRIFYFHVASATTCYLCFGTILVSGVFYLASKNKRWDLIFESATEVGFLFCTIVLITGMIWGHAAWNTVFRWEPRLVSFMLLWFMFISLFFVRHMSTQEMTGTLSSVLGIIGSITVPLTVFSVKLLPASQQLHPQVIEKGGLNPQFVPPLIWTTVSCIILAAVLIWIRFLILKLYDRRYS